MSLPKEIIDAKNLITAYEEKITQSLVPNEYTCICCKERKIKRLGDDIGNPLKQERGCWDDGGVFQVAFGYGSMLDLESFYIAICDVCMEDHDKQGRVINLSEVRKKLREVDGNHELF